MVIFLAADHVRPRPWQRPCYGRHDSDGCGEPCQLLSVSVSLTQMTV